MGDRPSTPGAASTALEVRDVNGITAVAEVDDALAGELADTFARWGRIQSYGLAAIAAAGAATLVLAPAVAVLVAVVCFPAALLVANFLTDRATVDEFNPPASRQRVELFDESDAGAPDFVHLGLSRPLARRLLRKTYSVPAAYTLLPAVFSKRPAARRAVVDVIRQALGKC